MVGTIVGEEQQMRHCFNYDSRGHLNVNCPTKNLGTKCRKYKHIASNCPKKDNLAKKNIVPSVSYKSQKIYERCANRR